MNLETIFSIGGFLCGLGGLLVSLFLFNKTRTQRGLLDFVEKQVEDLEMVLAKNKETLESNANRLSDQSRRLAWLETRVRQPKAASEEIIEELPPTEPQKLNMTERRYRVITLASRGQSAESIAATLGMLPGEVELIMNLNQCK